MSWKHYVGGIVTTVGVAGLAYLIWQADIVRGEKIINLTDIDGVKTRVVQQERWGVDTYRLELLDKEGNIRAKLEVGTHKPNISFYEKDPNKNLETSLSSKDF